MAFKYRKRVRIFPGFYLNLSKSGMSATVGMRGFNVNVGKRGTYLNTGIPGTGIYDRVRLDGKKNQNEIIPEDNALNPSIIPDDAIEIKSYEPELITSEGLYGLKDAILNAQKVKEELRKESNKLRFQRIWFLFLMLISFMMIFGIFIKWFKENYALRNAAAKDAKETYEKFKLDIEFNLDQSILNDYVVLKNSFDLLKNVKVIWDITSAKSVDRVKERSAASTSITRTKVNFSMSSLNYINTEYNALKFQNANGGDLFLYPGFIVMIGKNNSDFALIDFRDVKIEHHPQQFVETDGVPNDSKVVDYTWKYVNKNGSPDKRYKDNSQIPIALYYELTIASSKGLFESYHFSNSEVGQKFCVAFEAYKSSLQNMKWDKEEEKIVLEEIKN